MHDNLTEFVTHHLERQRRILLYFICSFIVIILFSPVTGVLITRLLYPSHTECSILRIQDCQCWGDNRTAIPFHPIPCGFIGSLPLVPLFLIVIFALLKGRCEVVTRAMTYDPTLTGIQILTI